MGVAQYHSPLSVPQALAAVENWLSRPGHIGPAWKAITDSDGAIGLVPTGPGSEPYPALLISEDQSGYAVTLCDPAAPEELGCFSTIERALHGIGGWITLAATGTPASAQAAPRRNGAPA